MCKGRKSISGYLSKEQEAGFTKEPEETFRGVSYIYYLYGDCFTSINMSKLFKSCSLNMCNLFCRLYFMYPFFKKEISYWYINLDSGISKLLCWEKGGHEGLYDTILFIYYSGKSNTGNRNHISGCCREVEGATCSMA